MPRTQGTGKLALAQSTFIHTAFTLCGKFSAASLNYLLITEPFNKNIRPLNLFLYCKKFIQSLKTLLNSDQNVIKIYKIILPSGKECVTTQKCLPRNVCDVKLRPFGTKGCSNSELCIRDRISQVRFSSIHFFSMGLISGN